MTPELRHLISLGRDHYHAGDYAKAEPCLLEVVKQHRGFADIFNMLGVICFSQGRFAEAEAAFESALEINPHYTEAALNLSVTYNDRGKYEKARDVYSKALAQSQRTTAHLDPFAQGKLANMHADLAAVYAGAGRYEEAVREYGKALDLCPDFIDIRTRLANTFRDMGKHSQAVAEYEKVKSTRASYAPARVSLGVALFALGKKDEAISEWQEVLKLEPDNKTARVYLRMVEDNLAPPARTEPTGGDSDITFSAAIDDE